MSEKNEMYQYVEEVAERNGYYLCPDEDLLDDLVEGLVENERRYGYKSCPCRPASGIKKYDVDILCPCEYCDADVNEHGMCYCGLFVSEEVNKDPSKLGPIPERRPKEVIDQALEKVSRRRKCKKRLGLPPVFRRMSRRGSPRNRAGVAPFVDIYVPGRCRHRSVQFTRPSPSVSVSLALPDGYAFF